MVTGGPYRMPWIEPRSSSIQSYCSVHSGISPAPTLLTLKLAHFQLSPRYSLHNGDVLSFFPLDGITSVPFDPDPKKRITGQGRG